MKLFSMTTLLTCACLIGAPLLLQAQPSGAQTPDSLETLSPQEQVAYITDLSRAKNLARQAAERANGGLSNYRAESSMHGNAADSPYVDNGDDTWTFTFRGGAPGSGVLDVETEVLVNRLTWDVSVIYNGAVR